MKRNPFPFLVLVIVVLLGLLGAVDQAGAQPVTNPAGVIFRPAMDHSLLTSYEFGYFTTAADVDPIRKTTILPADLTPDGADFRFPFPRLAFGSFTHKLRACAAAVCSDWAPADKPTVVSPFPPGVVRLGS
ncbi:MAG: hypothetical protein IPO08_21575 [Xanthomonadales bacterium]|nr:hypothetical protein [Xanthomonadales bacterium]